jgi:hypothetical protein
VRCPLKIKALQRLHPRKARFLEASGRTPSLTLSVLDLQQLGKIVKVGRALTAGLLRKTHRIGPHCR